MTRLDEFLSIKEASTWPKEQTPLGEAAVAMNQVVIENPILNSPFAEPTRHFRFSDEGITDEVVNERRISSYFVPIAQPKKKSGKGASALDN